MKAPITSPKRSRKKTALVIDRDSDVHRFVHVCLGKEFDVHHAYFPKLAASLLEKGRFTLVVSSMDMEERADAPELREAILKCSNAKGTPVIRLLPDPTGREHTASDSDHTVGRPLNEKSFYESLNRALDTQIVVPAYAN